MKRKLQNFRHAFLCISLILIGMPMVAQVTIGSGNNPNLGALLDLKEKDVAGANSVKGLMLPRVRLTNLKPTTPAELAASIGSQNSWDLDSHIGLVVYNTEADNCALEPIQKGVYAFDGEQWVLLNEKQVESVQSESASNSNRADWKSAWGTNVVLHEEKLKGTDIVYKEFYSADFGDAGRWMTTNLAAFLYDTDLAQDVYHTGGRNLSGPNGTAGQAAAVWAYPKATNTAITVGESASSQFLANHHIGLLYSWDAASAGKGGSTGALNMDNPAAGNRATNEIGLPEWNGIGTQPANTQKRRQGICPKGWHLPSDYEWTELEQEIIKNTSKYADMADINNADSTDGGTVISSESGTRGTHGTAIKSVCPVPLSTGITNGKSFLSSQKGLSVPLVGYAREGRAFAYTMDAYLWSSSSYADDRAWYRKVSSGVSTVTKGAYHYINMLSVRCKKDDN